MVEPLDPFQRRQFHCPQVSPKTAAAKSLGHVQPNDRLPERVVIAVADAPDGGLDPGLGQPLSLSDRKALHTTVTVVKQLLSRLHAAVLQHLLKRIQGWVGAQRVLHAPAHDPSGKPVDHEHHVDQPELGSHETQIGNHDAFGCDTANVRFT